MKRLVLLTVILINFVLAFSVDYDYALKDRENVVALWHMDSAVNYYVLDDDSKAISSRDNDLDIAYTYHNDPVLTTNNGGKIGEALVFDGDDMASADGWLSSYDSVKIEFWIYIENLPDSASPESGTNYIMAANGCWDIYLASTNKLYWRVYGPSSATMVGSLDVALNEDTWYHITAEYQADKSMSLQLDDNAAQTTTATDTMWQRTVNIQVGGRSDKPIERGFDGMLDDIRISSPEDVTITDNGSSVTLGNDIVEATISKSNGVVTSLKKTGTELMGNGGSSYVDMNYDDIYYYPLDSISYTLITNTPQKVEVSFKRTYSGSGIPFDIDRRFVLRRDISGIYSYVIFEYDSNDPAVTLNQCRSVWRLDKDIFDYMAVDDTRQWVMPTPADIAAGTTLSPLEATLLANGDVDHKYDYSVMADEHTVHGWCSSASDIGIWLITPSREYKNGGPSKQFLTAHQTTTTPVLLSMYEDGHYGSGSSEIGGENWEKIYGPYFVYLNSESNNSDMWSDAKLQAVQEVQAWPYDWVDNNIYPEASGRGTVAGTLSISDPNYSTQDAWVILAEPEDENIPNWQQQGAGYIFWTKAASDGTFSIDNVRPGSYCLYSVADDIIDEYRYDSVTVTANSTTSLGTLSWTPVIRGDFIWQIGTADRTAGEYLHGDEPYVWGNWFDYPTDFPDDITFVIGSSNEATDWNYAQVLVDNGSGYDTTPWDIVFTIGEVKRGQAILTIPIASSRDATLNVKVNGTEVYNTSISPNDTGIARDSIRGQYKVIVVRFATNLLNQGANTITLIQVKNTSEFCSILYDAVRLEINYDESDIAKWDMDETLTIDSDVFVPDNDASEPGRKYHLQLNTPHGNCSLTTNDGGYSGEALSFDGNDCATSATLWNGYDSAKIDLYFNADTNTKTTQYIAYVSGVWQLYCAGNKLTWRVYDQSGSTVGLVQQTFNAATWYHVIAEYNDGVLSLTLNESTSTVVATEGLDMWQRVGCAVVIGGYTAVADRGFDGLIDEVIVSASYGATKAYNPLPSNQTTAVSVDGPLSWYSWGHAESFDIYLGTNETEVQNATNLSDEFMGNQTIQSYSPSSLDYFTEYFWAIDTIGSDNTVAGDIWSFKTGGLSDDSNTVVLWHMDSSVGDEVLDDDSANAGRDNNLDIAYIYHNDPVISTGSLGLSGEALVFDGDDMAAADGWLSSYDSVKMEFWIYIENLPDSTSPESGTNYIMAANGCWDIYLASTNKLYWRVYGPSSATMVGSLDVTLSEDRWYHITAEYQADKSMSLQLDDNAAQTTTATDTMWQRTVNIQVGGRSDKPIERGFDGRLEEVKISTF